MTEAKKGAEGNITGVIKNLKIGTYPKKGEAFDLDKDDFYPLPREIRKIEFGGLIKGANGYKNALPTVFDLAVEAGEKILPIVLSEFPENYDEKDKLTYSVSITGTAIITILHQLNWETLRNGDMRFYVDYDEDDESWNSTAPMKGARELLSGNGLHAPEIDTSSIEGHSLIVPPIYSEDYKSPVIEKLQKAKTKEEFYSIVEKNKYTLTNIGCIQDIMGYVAVYGEAFYKAIVLWWGIEALLSTTNYESVPKKDTEKYIITRKYIVEALQYRLDLESNMLLPILLPFSAPWWAIGVRDRHYNTVMGYRSPAIYCCCKTAYHDATMQCITKGDGNDEK